MNKRLGLLTLILVGAIEQARGQELSRPSISTSGEATVYVQPDEVIVNLGVETADPELDKAQALNDAASAKLVKAIRALGVPEKQIQTDHLEIDLRYNDRQQMTVEGYTARRSYSVCLKQIDKFEGLVKTALQNGANRLLGFTYRTSELRKYRDQARGLAIKAAKEKAEALAGDLDCKVGHPRTINEGSGYSAFGGGGWGSNRYMNVAQNSVQTIPGGEGPGSDTLPLGQIAVQASVSVTFELLTPGAPEPAEIKKQPAASDKNLPPALKK